MIRVRKSRENFKIDTYYNKTFEDDPQKFEQPSLTDQSYFMQNDIYTLLAQGMQGTTPVQYGVQDFSSLSDLVSIKVEYQSKWNALPKEEKKKFGDFRSYVAWISDPANILMPPIDPVVPPVEEEKTE
jgi:hypothetical protein